MFGLSLTELVVISVVALLVLGPERIPAVARSIGRLLAEFRRAVDEVKYEFSVHNPPTNSNPGLRAQPPKLESAIVEVSSEAKEIPSTDEGKQ